MRQKGFFIRLLGCNVLTLKEVIDMKNIEQESGICNETFESRKIVSLNKFFMRNVLWGLIFSIVLFIASVLLLVFIIKSTAIDDSVKITIISMVATFVLTTSKSLIDRTVEIVVYIVRLLGEEQRGLNKKIGIEIEDVDYLSLNEEQKE